MNILEETIRQIEAPDPQVAKAVDRKLQIATEGDAKQLGHLRRLLLRVLAMVGTEEPEPFRPATIICCADHGVASNQVSAYPQSTTLEMAKAYLIAHGAAANAFAEEAGSHLTVIDCGMKTGGPTDLPGLIDGRIGDGTDDMSAGPAMTREQALTSIMSGIALAESLIKNGITCLMPGEMGIGNTTSSAALAAVFCHLTPEEATGRGTKISGERLRRKTEIVRRVLAVNKPDPSDPVGVLQKVGGFEFGCMTGLILGAAAKQKPVILDGINTAAAALVAQALAPDSIAYCIASQMSNEKPHAAMLSKLGLEAAMHLDFHLGEACGSSLLIRFIDALLEAWKALRLLPRETSPVRCTREYMSDERTLPGKAALDQIIRRLEPLSEEAMAACRDRIDHLAKPVDSLGFLEQIAVEYAGITGVADDSLLQEPALLCFTVDEPSPCQIQLTDKISRAFGCQTYILQIKEDCSVLDAFAYGFQEASDTSIISSAVALAGFESGRDDPLGTAGEAMREALLTDDGHLRCDAGEFLRRVPESCRLVCAAMMGAVLGCVRNNSLIITDDDLSDITVRYTEKLFPAVRPYILHVQPQILDFGIKIPGGIIGSFGLCLSYAAVRIMNRMKTFGETGVTPANDGPGAGRQKA